MHNGLSCALAKRIVEFGAVMLRQIVARERLASVLVDSLENLKRESQLVAQIRGQ